jgi:ABC-type polysaccharide/polyol phosphate transport system ATPase subunit
MEHNNRMPNNKQSCTQNNELYDVVIENVSKAYPKIESSSIEGSQTWRLLFKTLIKGKKKEETGKTFLALNNFSIKIKKGDSVGIIGLNGSGKSTLLQIIAGTLTPSTGEAKTFGRIGAMLELGSGFNPDFTGKENIYLNAKILGLNKLEVEQKYEEIKKFSGIGDFVNQPVRTYSSGMVVRLAFAVIAHVDPDILIIDEALAVGDARFQARCFSFLESFKESGKTLIFVSHDINSIARLCDSAVLLHKGKMLTSGIPKNVINEYSKIISGNHTFPTEDKTNLGSQELFSKNSGSQDQLTKFLKSKNKERSKDEFNYGGETAEIISYSINDKDGKESKVILSSEIFTISFVVLGKELIRKPIYAITILDTKGQQVYGQNTLFSKTPTNDLENGKKIKIIFQLSANLGAGKYLISFGVTRFQDDELQVIHRRYDAEELEIINTDGSFGIANCNCSIQQEIQSS